MKNKVLLLILDGFGINPSAEGNAVAAAHTPFLDAYMANTPAAQLTPSGLAVGLPDGTMGNSEVGHLNIGAGRIVYQLNTLIDTAIANGSFFTNPQLLNAINHAKATGGALHLMGLLSDGNVHSHNTHLWALLQLCRDAGLHKVYLHALMDGRDTLPHSGKGFMAEFMAKAAAIGVGEVATISGRYYAMDRDNRWERVEKAYRAMVDGIGEVATDPLEAIQQSYDAGVTDEFILPVVMQKDGTPVARISADDAMIFFNFRGDRARQITRALVAPEFSAFTRTDLTGMPYVTFNEYDVQFNAFADVAFRLPELTHILGEEASAAGLHQLRLAETEKYAHVTFFFNGGVEEPFVNEDRILIPSPKVATYDLQPQMSAPLVCDTLVEKLQQGTYEMIITNFANCDMVGHTGVFDAAVQAVETVDTCMSRVIPAAQAAGYHILLTADHGNAEKMLDEDGNVFTAHSTNPVPIVIDLRTKSNYAVKNGILADIAPTMLHLLGIAIPPDMTGSILIQPEEEE
jgi:2,3-bisphosphoglycerate-independent phosphoglycerate mutase